MLLLLKVWEKSLSEYKSCQKIKEFFVSNFWDNFRSAEYFFEVESIWKRIEESYKNILLENSYKIALYNIKLFKQWKLKIKLRRVIFFLSNFYNFKNFTYIAEFYGINNDSQDYESSEGEQS